MQAAQSEPRSTSAVFVFVVVAVITAAVSIFSVILMTEPGQSLDLPRDWVVFYYANRWVLIGLNLLLLGGLIALNMRYRVFSRLWMTLASLGVILCIIGANFLLPAFFPSAQDGAKYVTVAEADAFLTDESVIYAVEINGDVRGYPRAHLEIPHIAGDTIGGEEVAMTFCALSNLPVVVDQKVDGEKMDLGILIQTHNNLLMVDNNSGELVQQITGTKEFSGKQVQTYPNDMMSWASFKILYPEAKVFQYEFDRTLDTLLLALFEGPMEKQFAEGEGPVFPTLDLHDERLPQKEQVWGLELDGKQIAITKSFAEQNSMYPFEFAGRQLLLYHDQVLDVVTLFDRELEGTVVDVEEIDLHGITPAGRLRKVPMHNGVFWMVWSHWFPETEVLS